MSTLTWSQIKFMFYRLPLPIPTTNQVSTSRPHFALTMSLFILTGASIRLSYVPIRNGSSSTAFRVRVEQSRQPTPIFRPSWNMQQLLANASGLNNVEHSQAIDGSVISPTNLKNAMSNLDKLIQNCYQASYAVSHFSDTYLNFIMLKIFSA